MVVLDKTIDIRTPPDRVWHALTRISHAPSWSPGLVRATARDGRDEIGPGVVYHTVREDLGLHLESEQEAVVAEPPRRLAWRQRAGDFARHEGRYDLAPAAGGTRLRLRVLLELPFVLPRLITEEAIRRHYSSRFDAALITLKRQLEPARENL